MKVVKVGDIAEQVRGVTYSKEDAFDAPKGGAIALIRANNITEDGLDFSNLIWVGEGNVSAKQYLKRGDIVIAASSGSISVVGKAAQLDNDFSGTFGAFCKVLRPSSKVHDRYLGHFLRTAAYRRLISSLAAGANINNLKNEHLDNLEIPLPPLDEQRRIAAILDQADDLRRKRRAAANLLGTFGDALFQSSFGDPVRNELRHNAGVLEEVIDPTRPITYGILKPGEDITSGVPYIRVVDIKNSRVNYGGVRRTSREIAHQYRRSKLNAGDLLFSIRGHVGRMSLTPPELDGANITQDTARLAVQSAHPLFIMYSLRHTSTQRWLADRTRGIAVQGINLGDLRKAPIVLPPEHQQGVFAERIEAAEAARGLGEVGLTRLEALFNSLQHRAFNGEL